MRNTPTSVMIQNAVAIKKLGRFAPPPTVEQVLAVQAGLRQLFAPNAEYTEMALKDLERAITWRPTRHIVGATVEESCRQHGIALN